MAYDRTGQAPAHLIVMATVPGSSQSDQTFPLPVNSVPVVPDYRTSTGTLRTEAKTSSSTLSHLSVKSQWGRARPTHRYCK